jgi:hypothetical protein
MENRKKGEKVERKEEKEGDEIQKKICNINMNVNTNANANANVNVNVNVNIKS